ncbi:MAG: XRE family transcriptional regulator [Clostridia bacterium]|nr:XRE family transcriptional regulator [Clostridia bacterium]
MIENELESNDKFKMIIANNLVKYRKAAKLTQLELAERLLYSDKNISKWERGESIPDVLILKQIADIFGITVNDFLTENGKVEIGNVDKHKKREATKFFSKQQFLILFLSISLVWLVAVVVYSFFVGLMPSSQTWVWKIFIISLAVSSIISTVFSSLWCTNLLNSITVSFLIWTTALALFICIPFENNWLIFIIAIPLQILDIFWFIFKKINKVIKKSQEQKDNKSKQIVNNNE